MFCTRKVFAPTLFPSRETLLFTGSSSGPFAMPVICPRLGMRLRKTGFREVIVQRY